MACQSFLFHSVQFLHHYRCRRPAAIADGCDAVLARLKLVEEGGEDPRPGAADCVSERDGAAQRVHGCVVEIEYLDAVNFPYPFCDARPYGCFSMMPGSGLIFTVC
jgi:hypothetical protein